MKKLTHEKVFEYYKCNNYIMKNIYNGNKNKDQLICPVGHEIEMSFNSFKNNNSRCIICSGSEKHSQEYVYKYYDKEKYILNSIYKGNQYKDKLTCPEGHDIQISFNNFKQSKRCAKCAGNLKLSNEDVYNYYRECKYLMKSIYNGIHKKDKLICPVGHNIEMTFNHFKRGIRCRQCFFENNIGENHYRFNPNREEISLNLRLRNLHTKSWITKHMKDDPKFQDFLLNPSDYVVDHIIPVSLFCKLFTKYSLNEYLIKNIINRRDNLQLLTHKENGAKFNKGSSLFEAGNYLINNGVQLETFLEEKNS